MTKQYEVYIKSHSESPDYEAEFSENDLKDLVCKIPWADDVDEEGHAIGTMCGGKLTPLGYGGFKCSACQQVYQELEEYETE